MLFRREDSLLRGFLQIKRFIQIERIESNIMKNFEQITLIREVEVPVSTKLEKSLVSEIKEKVTKYGAETLSNTELIMILTGSSLEKVNAFLKENMLGLKALEEFNLEELKTFFTETKSIQLKLAMELSKRVRTYKKEQYKIGQPRDAADLLMEDLRCLKQEVLKVIYLNTKNIVIGVDTVSMGSLNSSIVHPREVFSNAIKRSAASIIVSHNHPSGDPSPSSEDINITHRLKESGKLLGIELLDHIIIGDGTYVSLKEKGIL